MKLVESFFVNGKQVGKIVQDDYTRSIAFWPLSGPSPLPERNWQSVDELKAELREVYGRPEG